ncbi:MAG: 3-hydroxyacyl-CoA dehydrogenase NAD-binding domain-containing protein [Planctomycetota bacterium]
MSAWKQTEQDGIIELVFDLPGSSVNLFRQDTMSELDQVLGGLAASHAARGLIVSSAKDTFIAGADVEAIAGVQTVAEGVQLASFGQGVFQKLERLPYPTIALIHGACLGGGLEFALACRHRFASNDARTKLGLPEVKLGIIPGFGGTQRLPRLIGLLGALDLILTGKMLDARSAFKRGLIDELMPREVLLARARTFLAEAQDRVPSRRKRALKDRVLASFAPARRAVLKQARARVQRETHGHYPAPLRAIESIERAFQADPAAGYRGEASAVGELIVSPVSRNLVRLFLITEEQKRLLAQRAAGAAPTNRAAVIGAGVMGAGIAGALAGRGLSVRIRDVNAEALRKGMAAIAGDLARRRSLTSADRERILDRIAVTIESFGFAHAELAIEAAAEKLEVKRAIFAELEQHVADSAILASNTSSLSLEAMAASLRVRGRFIGIHFFNPVARMPLVEIVTTKETAEETVQRAIKLVLALDKLPVITTDSPGFLVNRILAPYLAEAMRLAVMGTPPRLIDRALTSYGFPMGPFRLLDEVGLDIAHHVSEVMVRAFGDRMGGTTVVAEMVRRGALGKKVGRGFYQRDGSLSKDAGEVLRSQIGAQQGAVPYTDAIIERCVLPMMNEALRCLEEGLADRPNDLDIASVMGIGYPPFRGGVLHDAATRGLSAVRQGLEQLATKYEWLKPCALLVDAARTGDLAARGAAVRA